MYSTRLVNKNLVEGNAYITIGDPYKDRSENPFLKEKGSKTPAPFLTKVLILYRCIPIVIISLVTFYL